MDDIGSIILYTTPDGEAKIEVRLHDETVWLTLDQMAELFQRNKSTISRHIKNIFETGELNADSTVAFFATVQTEGKRKVERNLAFYNLDMIISVGYRVNSYRDVQFRQWATIISSESRNALLTVRKNKAPWHSDAEVKIGRLGYVILNGKKTQDFWDATIKCDLKPLRMKIRNICGDETMYIL